MSHPGAKSRIAERIEAIDAKFQAELAEAEAAKKDAEREDIKSLADAVALEISEITDADVAAHDTNGWDATSLVREIIQLERDAEKLKKDFVGQREKLEQVIAGVTIERDVYKDIATRVTELELRLAAASNSAVWEVTVAISGEQSRHERVMVVAPTVPEAIAKLAGQEIVAVRGTSFKFVV